MEPEAGVLFFKCSPCVINTVNVVIAQIAAIVSMLVMIVFFAIEIKENIKPTKLKKSNKNKG